VPLNGSRALSRRRAAQAESAHAQPATRPARGGRGAARASSPRESMNYATLRRWGGSLTATARRCERKGCVTPPMANRPSRNPLLKLRARAAARCAECAARLLRNARSNGDWFAWCGVALLLRESSSAAPAAYPGVPRPGPTAPPRPSLTREVPLRPSLSVRPPPPRSSISNSFTDLHKPTIGVDFHFRK
jgi:hypothetical protein